MERNYLCAVLALFVFSVPSNSLAQQIAYEDYMAIPAALRQNIKPNISLEKYISDNKAIIDKVAEDKAVLKSSDIEREIKKHTEEELENKVQKALRYDMDADGIITNQDMDAYIEKTFEHRAHKQRFQEMRAEYFQENDLNKDGKITKDEYGHMSEIEIKASKADIYQKYGLFLNIDENIDGTSLDELEKASKMAFATVDLNTDGAISLEEFATYNEVLKPIIRFPHNCDLPDVKDGTALIAIGVPDSKGVSTVSVSGTKLATYVKTVNITEDSKPLYLILSSFRPIIWRVTGNIDMIDKLVISGMYYDDDENVMAGVTGVPKEKISFLKRGCVPSQISQVNEFKGIQAKANVKNIVGRLPDIIAGHGDFSTLLINSEEVTTKQEQEGNILSESDFEKGTPDHFFYKGVFRGKTPGLIQINPEDVYSLTKVEEYVSPPGGVGILKLLKDGALKQTDHRNFKILKPLPYLPAEVGSTEAKYTVSQDIKLPEEALIGACIIVEETGKSIGKNMRGCY